MHQLSDKKVFQLEKTFFTFPLCPRMTYLTNKNHIQCEICELSIFRVLLKIIAWRQTLSFEKLFWSSREKPGYIWAFCWKTKPSQKWIIMELNIRLLLILKKKHLKLMILVLFCIWKEARIWGHWKFSLDMHLSYLGMGTQSTECFRFFSVLNSPQVNCHWVAAVTNGLIFVELE